MYLDETENYEQFKSMFDLFPGKKTEIDKDRGLAISRILKKGISED